jgi:tetratricopeptide (TPR) repeat protein
LSEDAGLDAATALLRLQIAERDAGTRLRFVHDKLTEVAAAEVSSSERRVIHRKIAVSLGREVHDDKAPPGHWARLTHHWAEACEPEHELPCADNAAEEALAAAAFADAARLYRRAISLVDAGAARGSALAGVDRAARREYAVALAEEALGNSDSVEHHARRALAHLGWIIPESSAGWTWLVAKQAVRQLGLLLTGSASTREAADVRERKRRGAQAASLLTGRYFFSDHAAGMLGSALLGVNLAESAGSDSDVPRSYIPLGLFAGLLGVEPLARRYFAKSLRGAEARHDPTERAFHLVGVSAYESSFGRWRVANESIERAVSLLEDVDAVDPFVREVVSTQLGHVEHFLGRYETAIDAYRQVLSSARARGNGQTTNWGLFSIGRSLLPLGRSHEALPLLEEAWAGLEQQSEIQSEVICLGLLALARLRAGDRRAALDHADATLRRIDRARSVGFPAAEGYSGAIEVYLDAMRARPAERASLEARAHAAVRAFRRLARLLPAATPLYRWRAGQLALARHQLRRARREYRAALELAARQGLPRETALAHWALAQLPQLASAEREQHRQDALRIAVEIQLVLTPEEL